MGGAGDGFLSIILLPLFWWYRLSELGECQREEREQRTQPVTYIENNDVEMLELENSVLYPGFALS